MGSMTVYKLDDWGRVVWQYPAAVLERGATHIRLEAHFNRDDMDLGYAIFARGDRFIETFYSDRWYNVFAIYGRDDGRLKGWYCNVCRPAEITATAVRCADLALDVWVAPDGATRVLDEEEFEASDLPAVDRQQAEEALGQLLRLALEGQLPR